MKIFGGRNVSLLFLGQVISQAGDSIYRIGLLWLVLELTGSKTLTGLMAAASFFPPLFFSLLAGALADRYSRIRIMLLANLMSFFLVIAIPLSYYFDLMTLPFLAVITFLVATGQTVFSPARDSIIPDIVDSPQQLAKANTLIQTSWQFAVLLGPACAAIILPLTGAIHLFTVDAFTYLIAFTAIALIRLPKVEKEKRTTSPWEDIKEGSKYVWKTPFTRTILIISVWNNFFLMGPAIVGIPIFVRDILKLEVTHYAWIEASLAGGIVFGIPLMTYISSRYKMGSIFLWGLVLDGLTYVPMYFATTFMATVFIIFFHSIFIPMVTVARTTLLQKEIPEHLRGRVFAIVHMVVIGSTSISISLTGILAEYVPMNVIYVFSGSFCAMSASYGFYKGLHRQ